MRTLAFLAFTLLSTCVYTQNWQWPVQDSSEQHRIVGTPGEDRGKTPNTRARHHRGVDISYQCTSPTPGHIHWDVYAIEEGVFYADDTRKQACMGHYHYTHLVRDIGTIANVSYPAGQLLGMMESNAYHLHLQVASEVFDEFLIYDSDEVDWVNPLAFADPFVDNEKPVIDDFYIVDDGDDNLLRLNTAYLVGNLDFIVNTHDFRVESDGIDQSIE